MRNGCQKTLSVSVLAQSARKGYSSRAHYRAEILLSFPPFISPDPFIRLSSAHSKLSSLIFHTRWRKRVDDFIRVNYRYKWQFLGLNCNFTSFLWENNDYVIRVMSSASVEWFVANEEFLPCVCVCIYTCVCVTHLCICWTSHVMFE